MIIERARKGTRSVAAGFEEEEEEEWRAKARTFEARVR
jgi:hypothetical protein